MVIFAVRRQLRRKSGACFGGGWRNNLGDFRAEVYRERPITAPEAKDRVSGQPK